MKNSFLFVLISLVLFSCSGNVKEKEKTLRSFPKLKTVVEEFYEKYDPKEKENVELSFAKKQDGWYVRHLKTTADSTEVRDEELFWSAAEKKFLDVKYGKANDDESAEEFKQNVRYKLFRLNEYKYDHMILYGYPGWENDVIDLFGSSDEVSDTTFESVAEAWNLKSMGVYWKFPQTSVYGECKNLPAAEKAKRYIEYKNKTIEAYDKIVKHNPSFETFIGSVGTKRATLVMDAWLTLEMFGDAAAAKPFLDKVNYSQLMKDAGYNFLACADQNAVLFTNGDLDTYPLHYLQEHENFRKDVTVINTSLLNTTEYFSWLTKRDSKLKSILTPKTVKRMNDLSGMVFFSAIPQNPAAEVTSTTYESFFTSIKNTIETKESDNWQFSGQFISLLVDTNAAVFSSLRGNGLSPGIALGIQGPKSYFCGDILMLDIMFSNFETRPVCYTSTSMNLLSNIMPQNIYAQGCVNRIIPEAKTGKHTFSGQMIPSVFEKNLLSVMRYPKSKVESETEQRILLNYQLDFILLADVMLNDSNKTKTVELIDQMQEKLPPEYLAYDWLLQYPAKYYYHCGEKTKSDKLYGYILDSYEKRKHLPEDRLRDSTSLKLIKLETSLSDQKTISERAAKLLEKLK